MPIYNIHGSEIDFYVDRAKRGELIIYSMTPSRNGYKLDIKETPRMASAVAALSLITQPDKAAPAAIVEQPVASVEMIECPHCTNKFPKDGVCEICNRFWNLREKAAERRRQYHLFKKGLAPRPA